MRHYRYNWLDLFYGFRIALDPRKMFLGFLMLAVILSASWVCDFLFGSWDAWLANGVSLNWSERAGTMRSAVPTVWRGDRRTR